ncbi:MAG: hypothetical protein KF685_13005 [Acidobacteria bacterium]|nr:hypothetical protein [Acidobacteriota bacterium]
MNKQDAESELEFMETSPEARAMGLRRIKRRHYDGPLELLPLDENVIGSKLLAKKIREQLLNDAEFVEGLREKLAA